MRDKLPHSATAEGIGNICVDPYSVEKKEGSGQPAEMLALDASVKSGFVSIEPLRSLEDLGLPDDEIAELRTYVQDARDWSYPEALAFMHTNDIGVVAAVHCVYRKWTDTAGPEVGFDAALDNARALRQGDGSQERNFRDRLRVGEIPSYGSVSKGGFIDHVDCSLWKGADIRFVPDEGICLVDGQNRVVARKVRIDKEAVLRQQVCRANIPQAEGLLHIPQNEQPGAGAAKSVDQLYQERVASAKAAGTRYSRDDDEEWARKNGVKSVTRRVRELRTRYASDWKTSGRPPKSGRN